MGFCADTKHYWKLTKHIFRYGHINGGDSFNGAHTVNEGAFFPHGDERPSDPADVLCRFLQPYVVKGSSRPSGSSHGSSSTSTSRRCCEVRGGEAAIHEHLRNAQYSPLFRAHKLNSNSKCHQRFRSDRVYHAELLC